MYKRQALDEPGFLSPATSPLSTLSADVDTASYCNLRRMVAQGYAPAVVPAGAVRTEELLNYFDYAYPCLLYTSLGEREMEQAVQPSSVASAHVLVLDDLDHGPSLPIVV